MNELVTDYTLAPSVIGTHGRRGLQRLALGSDAEMVLRTAPVPVLMVRSNA